MARKRVGALWRERRGVAMLEFALVGPIFLILLLGTFTVLYNALLSSALNNAVQQTARELSTGQAQPGSAAALLSDVLCQNTLGVLGCTRLNVRLERIDTSASSACPGGYQSADLFDATIGAPPTQNGQLALGLYGGSGGDGGAPVTCDAGNSPNNPDTGFCVAGPSSQGATQLYVLSAIYIAPNLLGWLTHNTLSYNGQTVSGLYASAAFATENFTASVGGQC